MARLVINDSNFHLMLSPVVNGETKEMGCVPRNFAAMPYGSLPYAAPFDMPLMSDQEIEDRIADQARNKDSLEHIRADCKIRSLDQDGWPYCWAFSTVKAVMLLRAAQNQPTVELSAWAVGAIVKGYQKQGGWCQESLELLVSMGCPSLAVWPQGEVKRSLDTAEMRADAGTRKVTEWMDMEARNKRQTASNLLRNIPTMVEYNWWSHSVCAVRLLSWSPFKILIDNSWSPTWDTDGMAEIEGSKAVPDNQACPRVTVGS
jgi:hypothetical protein